MLIVVRYGNHVMPDLFYFQEHELGNVEFKGKRYACLLAYSAEHDFAQMPEELKRYPWLWHSDQFKTAKAATGEAISKEKLLTTMLGETTPKKEDDIVIPVKEIERKQFESFIANAEVVDYIDFMSGARINEH